MRLYARTSTPILLQMSPLSPPRAVRCLPVAVNEVKQRQNWMSAQHARPSVPHHCPNLLSHVRLVTMHRALGARGLVFPERTSVKTSQCIVQKLSAFMAEFTLAPMVIVAIEADHRFNGFAFPAHPVDAVCVIPFILTVPTGGIVGQMPVETG